MASTQGKASKNAAAKSKAPAKQTTRAPARRRKVPTHEAIAKHAYELSRAHEDGDHVGHWLQAEGELTAP